MNETNSQNMESICSICCDTKCMNSLCSNDKCVGNICHNCISEIIKIKEYNDQIICLYECPFCKTINNNTIPHIRELSSDNFNNLIDKKVSEYNNEYRENTDYIIDEQNETIYDFRMKTQELIDDNILLKNKLEIQFLITEEKENDII